MEFSVKDREREKENADRDKEKEREKEKEKEKEGDVEAALYTNCLLLGLDPIVLGTGAGTRAGLFRHSNPRLGEALLHFLMCALRGPNLSAKDFAGVWPIFDAAQSRDFRKVVQGLINELESQGALPRSNSRVSSLATCCGQRCIRQDGQGRRFVELLWHLSAHALREVHRRMFPADLASKPLPASLTEIVSQSSRPSALLGVTKARIAMERKHFISGASQAVQRQGIWSSLGHDMTAEYRALCAEEAYLHQELEKLQESNTGDLWEMEAPTSDVGGFVTTRRGAPVARTSLLWDSLLAHSGRVAELASGPIEDLIARREHRFRIDGAVLRSAVDLGSVNLPVDSGLSSFPDDETSRFKFEGGLLAEDEKSIKTPPPVDVGEILRRWTHVLQAVHKQAVRLARSNNGAGPDLMMGSFNGQDSVHAHTLRTTLVEHKQHSASLQALKKQLEDSMPGMEAAITTLRERVDGPDVISASRAAQFALIGAPMTRQNASSNEESSEQSVEEITTTLNVPLELVPPSPALKLPNMSATSIERFSNSKAALSAMSSIHSMEALQEQEGLDGNAAYWNGDNDLTDGIASLRQAVMEAALQKPSGTVAETPSQPSSTEHYFTPVDPFTINSKNSREDVIMATNDSQPAGKIAGRLVLTTKNSEKSTNRGRGGYVPEPQANIQRAESLEASNGLHERLPSETWNSSDEVPRRRRPEPRTELHVPDIRPLSPPLILDFTTFDGSYDDLLAPMTDLDAAFMNITSRGKGSL